MAIEYTFELGAPATVDQVGEALATTAAEHQLVEAGRFDRDGAYLGTSGVWVSNYASSPLPFPDPVTETFGFAPVVNVLFRMDKGGDGRRQFHDAVRLVSGVLATVAGDALFTFAGELPLLRRHNGRLTIDTDSDTWTPDDIALLPSHDNAALPHL